MKSSIIILTYNSSRFIDALLKSIKDFAKDSEVLIVDNNSTDETVKLAKKYDFVKVLETGENLGFAKGINFGVKRATGDFLLFLNPDAVLESGKIEDFISIFGDPSVGASGVILLDFEGNAEKSAGKFFNLWDALAIALGLDEALGVRFSSDSKRAVDFVSGGAMMVRRIAFEKVGGFDENFFMYLEDMDFCYRLRKAGYKTVFTPDIVISHAGQGSSNREFAVLNIYKGLLYFYKSRKSKFEYYIVRFGLQTKARIVYILGRITDNSYYTKTYGKALKLF